MNKAIIYDFNTLLNTKRWLDAFTTSEALFKAHPKKVLTIRFEDFIRHEEKTLRLLCDFLSVQFLPEMLEISKSEEAKRISNQSSLWESNSSRPIEKNIDKFKTSLSMGEIEMIETLTGEFMDRYGYTRLTKGHFVIAENDLKVAGTQSLALKQKAWDDLKLLNPTDYIARVKRVEYLEECKRKLCARTQPKQAG